MFSVTLRPPDACLRCFFFSWCSFLVLVLVPFLLLLFGLGLSTCFKINLKLLFSFLQRGREKEEAEKQGKKETERNKYLSIVNHVHSLEDNVFRMFSEKVKNLLNLRFIWQTSKTNTIFS